MGKLILHRPRHGVPGMHIFPIKKAFLGKGWAVLAGEDSALTAEVPGLRIDSATIFGGTLKI